jgi:hypothetical protein
MENNSLFDNLDPIQFAKIIGDVVTEDAPVPEEWEHRRYVFTVVDSEEKGREKEDNSQNKVNNII